MKSYKKSILALLFAVVCLSSFFCINVSAVSSIDEAVISAQDDKYTPLYTKAPDSSLRDYSTADEAASRNYQLFYVQTTVLALIAGYLIIFKIKGINHDEKMHRRKKL